MSFKLLNLSANIEKTIKEKGYKVPTPIQRKVIPLIFEKKDMMVMAQTGTGKTASFVLPILNMLENGRGKGKAKLQVLVLAPTRELTLQISENFQEFGYYFSKKLKIVSVIGGEAIGEQLYDIQQGCDIVVATLGRFLDLISKKQMNLKYLNYLVLDEADKMLNLDFSNELDMVLEALPVSRQTLLFSATYPKKMLDIASKIVQNPVEVTIDQETQTVENIDQRVIEVNKEQRAPLLRHLLKEHNWKRVLVFMANKRATDNIAEKFRKHGFNSASFNGDLDQDLRKETVKAFKDAKIEILFATDIAGRGLDIDNIDSIINYDLPRSPADYIHRIGRTARAGKSGTAISFIDYETMQHFKLIEKRSNIKLVREQIIGFELQGDKPTKVKGSAPINGKKKSKKDKLREKMAQKSVD